MSNLEYSLQSFPELVKDAYLRTVFESDGKQQCTVHNISMRRSSQERWVFKRYLGTGGYGSVTLQAKLAGKQMSSELRAVKSIRIPQDDPQSSPKLYERELHTLAKFSQPKYSKHFVKSLGWFTSTDSVHIAMEYCELGDLQKYVNRCENSRLQESEIHEITAQILEALSSMHEEQFCHRDLKLANILIMSTTPWWVKLADFGLSKRVGKTSTTIQGTLQYMPPELFGYNGDPTKADQYAVDMWCLGQVIFRLAAGQAMFDSLADISEYYHGQTEFPAPLLAKWSISESLILFIQSLLNPEPTLRLSSEEASMHLWLSKPDVETLGIDIVPGISVPGISDENIGIQEIYLNNYNKIEYDQGEDPEPASASWSTQPAPGKYSLTKQGLNQKRKLKDIETTNMDMIDQERQNLSKRHLKWPIDRNDPLNGAFDKQGYRETEVPHLETLDSNKLLSKEYHSPLSTIHSLAVNVSNQGRYQEAEVLYRETIDLQKKVLGNDSPATLRTMNALAINISFQGRYREAEVIYRETADLRKKVLGAEHRDTLASMYNLALSISEQQRFQEAEVISRETADLRKKVLGAEHRDTLASMYNLALDIYKQQRFQEAEVIYRENADLQKKVLGKEHPESLETMHKLALTISMQQRFQEAEVLCRETLALRQKVLGKEHPESLETMNNLALDLYNQGKYQEAEVFCKETLDSQKKVLGKEHPGTLSTMSLLANIMSIQETAKVGKAGK